MKIKSLNLKNFKKFENISIDFDDNLNCISGNNGSGKTTILEAIAFCLYGDLIEEFRNLPLHRVGTTELSVNATFKNSSEFRIERSYSKEKKSHSYKLLINNLLLNGLEVKNIIGENFGDIKWFDFLISVNQFSHIEFINVRDRSFKQFILSNIVKINFEKIKNNLKTIERRLKKENNINDNKLINYEKDLTIFNIINDELLEINDFILTNKNELKRNKNNYTNKNQILIDYKNSLKKTQITIAYLNESIIILKNIKNNMETYHNHNKKFDADKLTPRNNLIKFRKFVIDELSRINQLIKNTHEEINAINHNVTQLENNIITISIKIQDTESILNECEYKISNLKGKIKSYGNINKDFINIKTIIDANTLYSKKINILSNLIEQIESIIYKNHIKRIIYESNNALKQIDSPYEIIYDNNNLSLLLNSGIINIHGLSAGEKVFINILIRCILYKLTTQSKFILIDDPFSRLDQTSIEKLIKLFELLSNQNMQIIYTSHKNTNYNIKHKTINLDDNINTL